MINYSIYKFCTKLRASVAKVLKKTKYATFRQFISLDRVDNDSFRIVRSPRIEAQRKRITAILNLIVL